METAGFPATRASGAAMTRLSPDTALREYLVQVAATPRLSPWQVQALAREAALGDAAALRALAESQLPLVVMEAAQRRGRGLRFGRLLACGNAALLKALREDPLALERLPRRVQEALESALGQAMERPRRSL